MGRGARSGADLIEPEDMGKAFCADGADGGPGPQPGAWWPTLPCGPSLPQFLMTPNSLSTCCESGGRTLADSGPAASAQAPVYCPVYESRLLATARHELNSAAALGVYGGPYGGSQGYGNYVTYGSEASAFYSLVRAERVYLQPSPPRHAPTPRFDLPTSLSQLGRKGREARGAGGGGRSASEPGPWEHHQLRPHFTPLGATWQVGRCV